jgi:hypothetical protein
MHLLLKVDWDTDGESLKACNLPRYILVFNAPTDNDDEDYLSQELSDAVSDTFGFCHFGMEVVLTLTLDDNDRADLMLNDRRLRNIKHLGIMEAPEKVN